MCVCVWEANAGLQDLRSQELVVGEEQRQHPGGMNSLVLTEPIYRTELV